MRNNKKNGKGRKNYDNKNRKPTRGNRFKDEECNNRDIKSENTAMNDVSWYSRYPDLLQAAGSFPYPYRPGSSLPLPDAYIYPSTTTTRKAYPRMYHVPGVMSMTWMPSVGRSSEGTDPASVMGKEFYARVRQNYSGSLEADGPDFVMYLMALDSIYSYIAWLKRLYRCISAWSPNNYVLPDRLLNAMGLSTTAIQTLRSEKTKLWQDINELVLQSRKFTCPAVMDIFNRHYWMSDNVYTDDPSINSQFYVFNLKAVYKYNLNTTTQQGELVATLMPWVNEDPSTAVPPLNADVLYQFGLALINALVAWDDAYTINGYLMRAFEGTPSFVVDLLEQDQQLTPVYEPEVLMQIENSRALPGGEFAFIGTSHSFNITQDPSTNAVVHQPWFSLQQQGAVSDGVNSWTIPDNVPPPTLSIRSDSPTVADSVIASRLQNAADIELDTTTDPRTSVINVHCGTEIVFAWTVYSGRNANWVDPTSPNPNNFDGFVMQPYMVLRSNSGISSLFTTLRASEFDWHPLVMITYVGATDTTAAETLFFGDTHNITTIRVTDLDNLHKICIYSEMSSFSIS